MAFDQPGGPLLPLLDGLDAAGLRELLARSPELAVTDLGPIPGHRHGAQPINYVAMLRYDAPGRVWRHITGAGPVAAALLDAGAPADGQPGETETPLITAASYGDAEVAQVLIDAGANLEAISAPDAGGVPSASPLAHAAIFGMTDVVDVLVRAGAQVPNVVLGAAAGDIADWDLSETDDETRLLALIMAADHQRLEVIGQLVDAGTPIDEADPEWGCQPLRLAARNGRPASVGRLLALGADPGLRDGEGRTALDLARETRREHIGPVQAAYDAVEALLQP